MRVNKGEVPGIIIPLNKRAQSFLIVAIGYISHLNSIFIVGDNKADTYISKQWRDL